MDNFYLKLILVIGIYIIIQYLYRKELWHTKGKVKWSNKNAIRINNYLQNTFEKSLEDIFISIQAIVCIIPIGLAVVSLFFIIIQGGIEFISKLDNWLQIVLISGYIILYFAFRISLDGKKADIDRNKETIELQKRKIKELENKVSKLN